MNKFCPLCKKVLLETKVPLDKGYELDYFCQTRVKFEGKASLPHYKEYDGQITWYLVPDYCIKTYDDKSSIYIVNKRFKDSYSRFTQPDFTLVKHLDVIIHPDDPEKLFNRIKTLILFS